MTHTAKQLIEDLTLRPHPEGGHYREVFRSKATVASSLGDRPAATAIYYMLIEGAVSRWHVVQSDEIWNFLSGSPLELLAYNPSSGRLETTVLTNKRPLNQIAVIPAGWWQAARPLGEFSLMGCVVAPGFEFSDFQLVRNLENHRRHFSTTLSSLSDLL